MGNAAGKSRTASTILMVQPVDFGFNEQTGIDNEFQTRLSLAGDEINRRALAEFQGMVDTLRSYDVSVLVLGPSAQSGEKAPDAVFPNNWLSTEHDGTLLTYPMKAPNRRVEVRLDDVKLLLEQNGYVVGRSLRVGKSDEDTFFLEGTGSLVIDHLNRTVYAAMSDRCDPDQFANFLKLRSYHQGILFETRSSTGRPIYHTNVMMSLGEDFAVICLECLPLSEQKQQVLATLSATYSEIIEISLEQVEQHFCGNILAIRNQRDQRLVVMSQRAFAGFSPDQLRRLRAHAEVVSVRIDTIEAIGGGSARCMMAEVYSPKVSARPGIG